MTSLKIATWNTNGLAPNKDEVEALLHLHNIDILLISETDFTSSSAIRIRGYSIYSTNHPDGTAHGGTAAILRSTIDHYELPEFRTEHIQATSISIADKNGDYNISAVYCPPKHKITEAQFSEYFRSLGTRFVAGGDWNSKHPQWSSRLTTTRGRELKKSIDNNNLKAISTPEPTHWPSDPNKLPDVLDFFITRGMSRYFYSISSSLDGSSNHISVMLTIGLEVIACEKSTSLYNKPTDWEAFRELVDKNLRLDVALKTETDIDDATYFFTTVIQSACWKCTPVPEPSNQAPRQNKVTTEIKQKILEKRRIRRRWHTSRHPEDKAAFNRAIKDLSYAIDKANNASIESYLESLTATSVTNYSLWRACKNLNQPIEHKPPIKLRDNEWARSKQEKANMFGAYLADVFKPNEADPNTDEAEIDKILNQDSQLDLPITPTSPKEINKVIKLMEDKKAPGFDLIDKKVLTELPKKAVVFLSTLFNGIMRTGYFPALWKVSQVIMIQKPGKPIHEVSSYRPISLLPVISKVFEKVLLYRLSRELAERSIIPDHQFGFRQRHGTVEQAHRVYREIRETLERKEYCSAAFLDIKQAFDRVWHKGLLCKIKSFLPHTYFGIIKSYLSDRMFQIKEGNCTSSFHSILAGVPQGSVLGPMLYTIYTCDLPQREDVVVATFADDTAILARSKCPNEASMKLQSSLCEIDMWLTKWRIEASAAKSVHVTFTLRKGNCPPVSIRYNQLPQSGSARYLGLYLDRRLTWKNHIQVKRDEINIRFRKLSWLLGRNSKLSLDNKLLIYKSILKPIWTYGIQLWGTACDSSIGIIQRAQNYILKQISNSPWFIRVAELHECLDVNTVKQEISSSCANYKTRLSNHPNQLAVQLTIPEAVRRLKRRQVLELDEP